MFQTVSGALNKINDPTLYTAVYRYLPFESLIFTSAEAEKAERIIVTCLGQQILAES